MNAAVAELRAVVARLVEDGRQEGIEPGGPLGRWLEGQVLALESLAGVLDGQADRFEEVIGRIDTAANIELEKVAAATEVAKEVVRQGNLAVHQARNAQILAIVEKEDMISRMIDKTLPLFAERLRVCLESAFQRASLRRSKIAEAA